MNSFKLVEAVPGGRGALNSCPWSIAYEAESAYRPRQRRACLFTPRVRERREIVDMAKRYIGCRSTLAALMGVVGLAAAACATAVPDITPQEITEVDVMIRRAETAGGERLAPELLGSSRESYDAARRASFARKPVEARRQLEEAKAYATAAEMQATAEQRQREALAIGKQADALDARLQDRQRRLRTPGQSSQ
jgi:hypothetical protein